MREIIKKYKDLQKSGRRIAASAFALLAMTILLPSPAFAACSSPAGVTGEIDFSDDYNMLQYCDDTNWIPMYFNDYWANAVTFDGTNDYLTVTSLADVSNKKNVTGSFWFRRNGGFASDSMILNNTGNGVRFEFLGDDTFGFEIRNSSNTLIFNAKTVATFPDTNWHHIVFSADLTDSNKFKIYVDNASVGTSVFTYTNDTMNLSGINTYIGRRASGGALFNGDLADLWVDFGTYIDLSNAANRAKFIDARNKPVSLGSTGARVTGSAPDIFLSGATNSWETNKGTGGGFTENGALTDAATDPGSHNIATSTDPCAPVNTPAIGQACDDGTKYAGLSPDGSVEMYTTRCDYGQSWNGSACTGARSTVSWNMGIFSSFTTGFTSLTDGDGNTSGLAALSGTGSPYMAAVACANLEASGHEDWYLPANDELGVLRTNKVALGNFFTTNTAGYAPYWSSTEASNVLSKQMGFWLNDDSDTSKYGSNFIRCTRKGYQQVACNNPKAVKGTMLYNTDAHVMQFCDGRDWLAMAEAGDGGGGCASPGGIEGEMVYNNTYKTMQYCEGNQWIAVGRRCRNALCGGTTTEKLVFARGVGSTGNFGGVTGADALCQSSATAAGLLGTYKAWIADSTASSAPATRFVQSTVPYKLVDGSQIAANWSDLVDGTLADNIGLNENGQSITVIAVAATNVNANGTQIGTAATDHCNNWSTGASTFIRGDVRNTDSTWTNSTSGYACGAGAKNFYCFEQ